MNFGEALRAEIETAGLTMTEVAELLDVSRTTISQWVRNVCRPWLDNYDNLLDLFPKLPGIAAREFRSGRYRETSEDLTKSASS